MAVRLSISAYPAEKPKPLRIEFGQGAGIDWRACDSRCGACGAAGCGLRDASASPACDSRSALLLRNHGALMCGRSVADAFVLMDALDKACSIQLMAQASGARLYSPGPDVCRQAQVDLVSDGEMEWAALLAWLWYLRLKAFVSSCRKSFHAIRLQVTAKLLPLIIGIELIRRQGILPVHLKLVHKGSRKITFSLRQARAYSPEFLRLGPPHFYR